MLGSADSFDVDCCVIVPKDLFLDNHMAVIPTQEFSTTPKEKERLLANIKIYSE